MLMQRNQFNNTADPHSRIHQTTTLLHPTHQNKQRCRPQRQRAVLPVESVVIRVERVLIQIEEPAMWNQENEMASNTPPVQVLPQRVAQNNKFAGWK